MDIYGFSTDVSYLINTDSVTGHRIGGSGNGSILVDDNFYSVEGNIWSVSFAGLDSGLYDVFYYGPSHGSVNTGTLSFNGLSADSVSGAEYGGSFIEGTHYDVAGNVYVGDDGTLTLSSSDTIGNRGFQACR